MQEGLRAIGDKEVLKKIVYPRPEISQHRQCELMGINRSSLYYTPVGESEENLELMRKMDEEFLEHPTKGVLGMVDFLLALGILVGPKRVRRLLRKMNIMAIYPQRNLSKLGKAKYVQPYKLRKLEFPHSNHVWSIDISYIPMEHGFMYLTTIIDVYSRYIVGWGLSNSLDGEHSLKVLREAVTQFGKPDIVNSDQGSQFTCKAWIEYLHDQEITISMDGRGRCLDNVWIERFWRTIKQEYVYLNPADNNRRTHRSLDRLPPFTWYEYAA